MVSWEFICNNLQLLRAGFCVPDKAQNGFVAGLGFNFATHSEVGKASMILEFIEKLSLIAIEFKI